MISRPSEVVMLFVRAVEMKTGKVGNMFGAADPFFEVINHQGELVARSAIFRNDLYPQWPPIRLDLEALCRGDPTKEITLSFYDWQIGGDHELMGEFKTNLNGIAEAALQYETQVKVGFLEKEATFSLGSAGRVFIYDLIKVTGYPSVGTLIKTRVFPGATSVAETEPETDSASQSSSEDRDHDTMIIDSSSVCSPILEYIDAMEFDSASLLTQNDEDADIVVCDNGSICLTAGEVPDTLSNYGASVGPSEDIQSDGEVIDCASVCPVDDPDTKAVSFDCSSICRSINSVISGASTVMHCNGDASPRQKSKPSDRPVKPNWNKMRRMKGKSLFCGSILNNVQKTATILEVDDEGHLIEYDENELPDEDQANHEDQGQPSEEGKSPLMDEHRGDLVHEDPVDIFEVQAAREAKLLLVAEQRGMARAHDEKPDEHPDLHISIKLRCPHDASSPIERDIEPNARCDTTGINVATPLFKTRSTLSTSSAIPLRSGSVLYRPIPIRLTPLNTGEFCLPDDPPKEVMLRSWSGNCHTSSSSIIPSISTMPEVLLDPGAKTKQSLDRPKKEYLLRSCTP